MNMRDLQKAEAIAFMKMMGYAYWCIEEFEKDDVPILSDDSAVLWHFTERDMAIIKDLEEREGCLVYAGISPSRAGRGDDFLTLLYISRYPGDWEEDWRLFQEQGIIYAYVHNFKNPEYSELGAVYVEVSDRTGGLRRIG